MYIPKYKSLIRTSYLKVYLLLNAFLISISHAPSSHEIRTTSNKEEQIVPTCRPYLCYSFSFCYFVYEYIFKDYSNNPIKDLKDPKSKKGRRPIQEIIVMGHTITIIILGTFKFEYYICTCSNQKIASRWEGYYFCLRRGKSLLFS